MTVRHMTLLENGIDFVRSGIETFYMKDDPQPRDHKYAILHMFAGILLLLKERLRREHASLIFVKVEEISKPDAKTVDFDTILARLNAFAPKSLRPEDQELLKVAQKLRNRLEHYHVEMDLKVSQETIAKLCGFIYSFLKDELGTSLHEHLDPDAWERVQELREIDKKLREEELAAWTLLTAPYRKLDAEGLARLGEKCDYHPKLRPDGRDPVLCELCGQASVVRPERHIAVCTNPECHDITRSGDCDRCGATLLGKHDGLCEDCFDSLVYGDD